jgi:hypothetical protein
MADITVTAAQVGLVDPLNARVKSYLAGSTITKGQAVAQATDGSIDPADASDGGGYLYEQFRGIALNGGAIGQAIDVCEDGELYGFTVSGMNSTDFVYLSNTAGALSTTVGDVTVYVGKVQILTDKSLTEVLRVQVIYSEAIPVT